MELGLITGMIAFGFAATVGEKLLITCGKCELANFVNVVGLVGLGLTTITQVAILIAKLGKLL